jgi:beta-lactamase class A
MFLVLTAIVTSLFCCAPSAAMSNPLSDLQARLRSVSQRVPARVGIAIEDLNTGTISGINANASMPAASTIKVPVMVEVFEQMSQGRVSLNKVVHLMASDRDWGWGELCDAPLGSGYSVSTLLWKMITQSDNTATNMLIRLVGRQSINVTMHGLGLTNTRVADYIRSDGDIRSLRSSAGDMAHLLDAIARDQLIDQWSSRQMMLILEGQTHNGLLPVPLPRDLKIAHKTGELHDTLNDVGIVEDDREPYIIAVMTTALPTLDIGRSFIQGVSKLTYNAMEQFASWRQETGLTPVDRFTRPADTPDAAPLSPDLRMWLPADSSKEESAGAD